MYCSFEGVQDIFRVCTALLGVQRAFYMCVYIFRRLFECMYGSFEGVWGYFSCVYSSFWCAEGFSSVYIHVDVYVSICLYVFRRALENFCLVCMLCICICMYTYPMVNLSLSLSPYIDMHTCMYTYVYTYLYIYVYMYISLFLYTYIYAHVCM